MFTGGKAALSGLTQDYLRYESRVLISPGQCKKEQRWIYTRGVGNKFSR